MGRNQCRGRGASERGKQGEMEAARVGCSLKLCEGEEQAKRGRKSVWEGCFYFKMGETRICFNRKAPIDREKSKT